LQPSVTKCDFAKLWRTDPEFRRRILREWDKIGPYKARGFIAEWPVK
jgi:hypothetical protein